MVVISNGHSRFFLGTAATESQKRAILDGYVTAGYPTRIVKQWARILGLRRFSAIRRLLDREERIPEHFVHPLWMPELLNQLAGLIRRTGRAAKIADYLDDYSLRLYSCQAARIVGRTNSRIYHYRAGYGHRSVEIAKQKGMLALCDHSLAHPAVIQYLIDHRGQLPSRGQGGPMSKFWTNILKDIEQADCVLANSEFVKETFVNQGWDPQKIRVIYAGIDDDFIDAVPIRKNMPHRDRALRFMFAGEIEYRKGAREVFEAFASVDDCAWELTLVGRMNPVIQREYSEFLKDSRVTTSGVVPRLELAKLMTDADVFIFPSLAEGSARVVFMAMACGCYVITTPNTGSVVRNGIDGVLVPPGNVEALREEIRRVCQKPQMMLRAHAESPGFIRKNYAQAGYGDNLRALYEELVSS